jgi:hypothetical protein
MLAARTRRALCALVRRSFSLKSKPRRIRRCSLISFGVRRGVWMEFMHSVAEMLVIEDVEKRRVDVKGLYIVVLRKAGSPQR